jgi:putative aldouronate transport system permease protein
MQIRINTSKSPQVEAVHTASTWKRMLSCWQLYVFLALPVIYILVFSYYPMLGAQIAFKKFNPVDGIWGSPWVGVSNFTKFFGSYMFERVIINTLRLSLYSLAVSFPLTILLALVINAIRSLKFKKIVQMVSYIPHFISTVVMVGMIFQLLSPVTGLYSAVYKLLGFDGIPMDILGKPDAFPHIYIWSGIWQGIGWGTIIYIAALSGVDPNLHEAAKIDGASRWQRIRHIDFPSILPTASIMLILSAGGIMNVGFEKVFLMQNNLNLRLSEVISTYVYKTGLSGGARDYSYSSAIGMFNSVINCLMLILVNFLSKHLNKEGASLW